MEELGNIHTKIFTLALQRILMFFEYSYRTGKKEIVSDRCYDELEALYKRITGKGISLTGESESNHSKSNIHIYNDLKYRKIL